MNFCILEMLLELLRFLLDGINLGADQGRSQGSLAQVVEITDRDGCSNTSSVLGVFLGVGGTAGKFR